MLWALHLPYWANLVRSLSRLRYFWSCFCSVYSPWFLHLCPQPGYCACWYFSALSRLVPWQLFVMLSQPKQNKHWPRKLRKGSFKQHFVTSPEKIFAEVSRIKYRPAATKAQTCVVFIYRCNIIKLKCWEGDNIPLEAAKLPAASSFWLGWFLKIMLTTTLSYNLYKMTMYNKTTS